ncbi:MAG: efflux RND transporter periplasmic adaptor subunit [Candidatus Krumholzibacteriia bacterium]
MSSRKLFFHGWLLAVLVLAATGCSPAGDDAAAESSTGPRGAEAEAHAADTAHDDGCVASAAAGAAHDDGCAAAADDAGHDDAGDDHAGHAHAAGSDLDRDVAELFADRCEHAVATHACDECRYEVGVVMVPRELREDGLVRTAAVATQSFGADLELTGTIQFDDRRIAHLGAQVSGLISRVLVDLGRAVTAGEVLLEVDSPELASAQSAWLEAVAVERLARRTHDRQHELRQAGITSEREYLEAQQGLEAARLRSQSERQKLVRLGLTDDELAALAQAGSAGADGRYLLRAPFAGEILEMHAVRGEWVETGGELILLGDLGTLWVWVDLYESDLAAVSSAQAAQDRGPDGGGGLAAAITVPAYAGQTFPGRVDFVGRTMQQGTRTVRARVTVANPDGLLKPGMFARVRLDLGSGAPALAVPREAVLEDEGRAFVFVHHDGDYFVRRPVVTGRSAGGWVPVLEGLSAGQSVVAQGSFLLKSDVLRAKMGEGCAH